MDDRTFDPSFYREELGERILPFWLRHSPDREAGGFFTCFSNDGGKLLSTDKFTWSQGRMVWVLSHMARTGIPGPELREECLSLAAQGTRFLMERCLLPDGSCAFLMDRWGAPKTEGGSSLYADCFAVLGLAEYARAAGDSAPLEFAVSLYGSVRRRVEGGRYATDPYPVPEGLLCHGVPMLLMNTARTLADALQALGDGRAEAVSAEAYESACRVLDRFADGDDVLREFIRLDGRPDDKTLLCRYCNPGHTVEDAWFMQREFQLHGDREREARVFRILKNALHLGWDRDFGGIQLFADREGGAPAGRAEPYEREAMTRKVKEDWGSKLWWPHSEALYASLLASRRTGDPAFADWARRIFRYTFETFPNRENGRGEWIQIRDRQGRPENRLVALPVKDPFHIQRNLLLLIELLETGEETQWKAGS